MPVLNFGASWQLYCVLEVTFKVTFLQHIKIKTAAAADLSASKLIYCCIDSQFHSKCNSNLHHAHIISDSDTGGY